MIRLIVRVDDAAMAANVGGQVHSTYRTFDVDLPEVEEFLRAASRPNFDYRTITGAEIVEPLKETSDVAR